MRRLTRWEYNNTLHDLLGVTDRPADGFPAEAAQFGFDNNAQGAVLSPLVVESYESAASSLALRVTQNLPGLLGCDPAVTGEDACASSFVGTFAKRAFRRPLRAAEQTRFEAFYQTSKAAYGFADAIRMLVQAVLQSPNFLYRLEMGVEDAALPGALRLSSAEMASRLSYLFTGSMPDVELLGAAEGDLLSKPTQILAQAQRLLESEAGGRMVKNFVRQWAVLNELRDLDKVDAKFTPEVGDLLELETETFVDQIVRKGDGKLSTLMTAPYSFMNQELAAFYGLSGPTSAELVRVELDPTRYAGILSQAGLMANLAHPSQPSAVRRGKFVLEKLLCIALPPPPNDVDTTLPKPDPTATARAQLTQKTSVQPCLGCHTILNPPGFAFEHFDELGRYRADEHGLAIDSSGVLTGTDVDRPFASHVELSSALSESAQVRSCLALNWFRYAYGRDRSDADACSLQGLESAFTESGGNVKSLLLALTQTPEFLYRNDPSQGGAP